MNANDYSNEGIIHTHKPFFSVQVSAPLRLLCSALLCCFVLLCL
jgi:hypothetical protein